MKKTIKELLEVDGVVGGLYQEHPDLKKTKFGYAWDKFYKLNITPSMKKWQEDVQDIRSEHALEDEKTKEILIDKENPRGYKYSKAGELAVRKAERELFEKFENVEVEVELYISAFVPDYLTDEQKEILQGTILE